MKKALVIFSLLIFLVPVFGESTLAVDDILLSDIPICYGEERFAQRILERTKGQRDPVGLVLTGGSARAFAHIGVLNYLDEIGIEPDFIVSNSMGSIIAMLYSAGLAPNQILEVINSAELNSYFNLTLPVRGGLLDPSGFEGLVASVIGKDVKLEELPIPVMVVCEDLVTKREVRIFEGEFTKIMLASFALPVYFPPQDYKGHLLIDGGIKSLAPIELAYKYSDTVIASTTFYDVDTLNLRNVITILNGAFDINKRYNAASNLRTYGDRMIWIRCAVEQFSFMAFDKASVMADIGYESAKAQAEALAKLYRPGISQVVSDKREFHSSKINTAKNNLYFFNRIEQPFSSQTISLGFHSYEDKETLYYLKQSFDYGFEYQLHNKKIEIGLLLGGSSISQVLANSHNSLIVAANFNYFPISRMKLSLYTSALFNNKEQFYIPSIYASENMILKLYSKEKLEFSITQIFEINHSFEGKGKTEYLLAAKGLARIPIYKSMLDLSCTYINMGTILPNTNKSYADLKLSTRLQFEPLGGAYLDLAFLSRFAVDGSKGVPLFYKDGFLTNDEKYYKVDTLNNDKFYLFLVPISMGYAIQKAPTFAEVVILQAFEIGAYCDLLFDDSYIPRVSTGAEIKAKLSIIGLQSIPFTFRVGYDSVSKKPIYSIRFAL